MQIETNGRISKYWPSQAAVRELIAEHGCRLCTWKFPGEIYDVSGDLWCCHCVREAMEPGNVNGYIADLGPALIPTP